MTAHLRPGPWAAAHRALLAKALGELAHERVITPRALDDGRFEVTAPNGARTTYAAARGALDHWDVDPESITRDPGPVDVLAWVVDHAEDLGLEGERLGIYLEELTSTLAADAYKRSKPPVTAAELARADFQRIESRMTEGHPCFVANSGRIGWGVSDLRSWAPEAAVPRPVTWVAGHAEQTTASYGEGLTADAHLDAELGEEKRAAFTEVLEQEGLDPAEYVMFPVHPWQWDHRLAVTFAHDVATRRLVHLGDSDDLYLPQQSIRTAFNLSHPERAYVKTALSVVNMGFVRGLSAKYMEGTPQINDWVAELATSEGAEIIRERAAVGFRPSHYGAVDAPRAPYAKMLAALWRESPVPKLRDGERLSTMAALLHVDRDGRSFAGALIDGSGLTAQEWLARYLDAYLVPLLRLYARHGLVFMPHGENVILVLEDDAVARVILKDVGEEVVLMDPDRPLPPEVERIRADVPDALKALSILTDVVDCFLRFLDAILQREGRIAEDDLWRLVAERAEDAGCSELLQERFALSCLNRLQLADPTQMVDLQDPAGSLQIHGELANPLAAALTPR